MHSKSAVGALVLIGLGVLFLLSNLGMLPPLGPLFARWWPLILIAVGVAGLLRRSRGRRGGG
jgi:lia operon protein LiaF